MKKATKAAIFVTAAAALYGAAAYGVTRTLMDVAMKREAPKALKNKGSASSRAKSATNPTVRRARRREKACVFGNGDNTARKPRGLDARGPSPRMRKGQAPL